MDLTQEEKERYSRHLRLGEFSPKHQWLLRESSVLIVGLGGLGSPASLYLAAAGVGRIGLVDFDRVERHNLQRQVLYVDGDVGRGKAEAAAERLLAMNPGIRVDRHPLGLNPSNALKLFEDYDVILDGSDNFATRFLVNDASRLGGKPLVWGSVLGWEGQVSVFNRKRESPCYRCLFPNPPAPGEVPSCDEAGVIGALPGVVGSLQAMECIKLITGIGECLEGKILCMDLMTGRVRQVSVCKDPGCPLCGENAVIRDLDASLYPVPCLVPDTVEEVLPGGVPGELSVDEAVQLLGQGRIRLLDVREADEVAICAIPGSVRIPMGSIPERAGSLERKTWWVVHCHHGMRSARVARYLRSIGFPAVSNLAGGIDQWAVRLAPDMRRY